MPIFGWLRASSLVNAACVTFVVEFITIMRLRIIATPIIVRYISEP